MKHKPGSFTKNFAWHGTGLRKLHTVTKAGFHATLMPISRQTFRDDCGVDEAASLNRAGFAGG